jgi:hypothetical protein
MSKNFTSKYLSLTSISKEFSLTYCHIYITPFPIRDQRKGANLLFYDHNYGIHITTVY